MKNNNPRYCLLVIDMQKEYFEKSRPLYIPEGKSVLQNVIRLINFSRGKNIPIIHVRHISKNPMDETFGANSPFVDFADDIKPKDGERIVTKHTPGSFYKTRLNQILKKMKIDTVIICGLTSFLCCDTTARETHALGYKVMFVKDATAALDINNISHTIVHEVVCAIQAWFFAYVVTTEELIRTR